METDIIAYRTVPNRTAQWKRAITHILLSLSVVHHGIILTNSDRKLLELTGNLNSKLPMLILKKLPKRLNESFKDSTLHSWKGRPNEGLSWDLILAILCIYGEDQKLQRHTLPMDFSQITPTALHNISPSKSIYTSLSRSLSLSLSLSLVWQICSQTFTANFQY